MQHGGTRVLQYLIAMLALRLCSTPWQKLLVRVRKRTWIYHRDFGFWFVCMLGMSPLLKGMQSLYSSVAQIYFCPCTIHQRRKSSDTNMSSAFASLHHRQVPQNNYIRTLNKYTGYETQAQCYRLQIPGCLEFLWINLTNCLQLIQLCIKLKNAWVNVSPLPRYLP